MDSEFNRLKSLEDSNYYILNKDLLALTGFFANKKGHLTCNFCNFKIVSWSAWVNEVDLHNIKKMHRIVQSFVLSNSKTYLYTHAC